MILRHRNTIAGAVCRATLRTEADPGYLIAEPAAYKCALVERGCDPLQICEDADSDFRAMLRGVKSRPDRDHYFRNYYRDSAAWPFELAAMHAGRHSAAASFDLAKATSPAGHSTRRPFALAVIAAAGHSDV